MSLKIKICGITNASDALAAVELGADALGFMLYSGSTRAVDRPLVAAIIRDLPPFIAKVGVFVDADEEQVRAAIEECGLDTLQFHGNESPQFCRLFQPLKTFKAFRIHDASALKALVEYKTDAWLLDSHVPGRPGGTGVTFDWSLARQAKSHGRPIILAGGLSVANVAEAVRQVRPFGLDVSSGVESKPGKKDHSKVADFILRARSAMESRD